MLVVWLVLAGGGCNGGGGSHGPSGPVPQAFVPNTFSFWNNPKNFTTSFGPAYADITLAATNFLPCRGGPFALCYYSGPSPQTCKLSANGRFADCDCFEIPYGAYFVDINAILNHQVYLQTVAACGADGSGCAHINSAPVCQNINEGKLIPGTDLFSTFSFDCVPTNGIGQTNCPQAPYAGCMTAACFPTSQDGIVSCRCPVFDGPYQIGLTLPPAQCTVGGDLVWSAAFAPAEASPASMPAPAAAPATTAAKAKSIPVPTTCFPDAPGSLGCPLFKPGQTLPPDSGVDCTKVCAEYTTCQTSGIQTGLTCDATLCTDNCNDRDLVKTACGGLSSCDVSEIVKAEEAAQCSCCASQLCGCPGDAPTNTEIFALNQQQRDRGITPQCDVNGTLCGSP